MSPEYSYIESRAGLDQVVDACRETPVIALDTEFARFNTYYPIAGLIQIYTGRECFLIDPVSLEDASPLTQALTDPNLLKVLHSGSEDMEVFQHLLGRVPSPVHDTQVASAFLGTGFSIGYHALVLHHLGLDLPKDQTRSDWLARPLSRKQMDYAALDVIHLLGVYEKQRAQLEGTEKQAWVAAESALLGQDIPTMTPPEDCYLKQKGLWQLDRQQLYLFRLLCAWREKTARQKNFPRNRIVDQKALMQLAREGCASRQACRDAGMSPRQVRKYADEIILLQAEAKAVPEADCPPLIARDDASVSKSVLKQLRQLVEETAAALDVAPEMLAKRRHLERLIRSGEAGECYHLPDELSGWRQSVIGDLLLDALTGQETLQ